MKHFAIITTCDRPHEETITASYASVVLAGWRDPYVCIDGPAKLPVSLSHVPVVRSSKPNETLGSFPTFRVALASGFTIAPSATHFAIFQDDIEVCAGLLGYLESNMPRTNGVVSLYTPAPLHLHSGCEWHQDDRVHTGGWGALGYIFSRDAARDLLNTLDQWADMTSRNLTDYWVGQWSLQNERPYYLHSPSFIRHTGINSAIGYGRNERTRQCQEWCADASHLRYYDFDLPDQP